MRIKIVITVPTKDANDLRAAIGAAGGGEQGEYSFCSFTLQGTGRFLPSENAHPHTGTPGVLEMVEEDRIEVTCDQSIAKTVVDRTREVHPYEEPAINVYQLLDEADL